MTFRFFFNTHIFSRSLSSKHASRQINLKKLKLKNGDVVFFRTSITDFLCPHKNKYNVPFVEDCHYSFHHWTCKKVKQANVP